MWILDRAVLFIFLLAMMPYRKESFFGHFMPEYIHLSVLVLTAGVFGFVLLRIIDNNYD